MQFVATVGSKQFLIHMIRKVIKSAICSVAYVIDGNHIRGKV